MSDRIRSIEGLRTIGWIGLLICQFRFAFLPGVYWVTDGTPVDFIYSGDAFARLLFVISGFVLSYKHFCNDDFSVKNDLIKRYLRLMPALLVAGIAVFLLMVNGLLFNTQAASLLGTGETLGAYNQFNPDFLECLKESMLTSYLFGSNAYIAPLWTMVYQYLGALLVFACLAVLKKSSWRWVFYVVFLFAFSNYYNYFVLGMLVSDLIANYNTKKILQTKVWLRASFIIIGFLLFSMVDIDDADKVSRFVFGAGIALFVLGVISSRNCEKILGSRIMAAGGNIAYSVYLIHWPVLESLSCGLILLFNSRTGLNSAVMATVFVITLVAVIVLSVLMKRYIEPLGIRVLEKLTTQKLPDKQ